MFFTPKCAADRLRLTRSIRLRRSRLAAVRLYRYAAMPPTVVAVQTLITVYICLYTCLFVHGKTEQQRAQLDCQLLATVGSGFHETCIIDVNIGTRLKSQDRE